MTCHVFNCSKMLPFADFNIQLFINVLYKSLQKRPIRMLSCKGIYMLCLLTLILTFIAVKCCSTHQRKIRTTTPSPRIAPEGSLGAKASDWEVKLQHFCSKHTFTDWDSKRLGLDSLVLSEACGVRAATFCSPSKLFCKTQTDTVGLRQDWTF